MTGHSNNPVPYAPFLSADKTIDGRTRIRARCCHCEGGQHWFPLLREVHCPRTHKPLRITAAAIVQARKNVAWLESRDRADKDRRA